MLVAFQPYEWRDMDIENKCEIFCYAVTKDGDNIVVRIQNYCPYVDIIVNTPINKLMGMTLQTFWQAYWQQFVYDVNNSLKEHRAVNANYFLTKELYNYQEYHNHPCIRLYFQSIEARKHCVNLLKNFKSNLFKESKYICIGLEKPNNPEYPIFKQYLNNKKFTPAKWFACNLQLSKYLLHKDIPEYLLNHKDLTLSDKDYAVIPPVFSFDMEVDSASGEFPAAENEHDEIYMLTVEEMRNKVRKQYAIVTDDYYDLPDLNLIKVNTEAELISTKAKLLLKLRPSIITGYNIFGFDNGYLETRRKRYFTHWPNLSPYVMLNNTEMVDKSWESDGRGKQEFMYLNIQGVPTMDMLMLTKIAKTSERSYSLKNITEKYLPKHKGKIDLPAKLMFKYRREFKKAKLQLQLSGNNDINLFNTYRIYRQGLFFKKHKIVNSSETKEETPLDKVNKLLNSHLIPELANICVEYYSNITQEMIDYFNAVDNMTQILVYAVRDATAPIDLLLKFNTWLDVSAMSNASNIQQSDVWYRGQQLKVISLMYKYALDYNISMTKREFKPEYFKQGATVVDPTPGTYDNTVILDFNSLYPSIVILYNICFSTFGGIVEEVVRYMQGELDKGIDFRQIKLPDNVNSDDYWVLTPFFQQEPLNKEKTEFRITPYCFRWRNKKHFVGLIPQMCKQLIADRKIVKKKMELAEEHVKRLELIVNSIESKSSTDKIKDLQNKISETEKNIRDIETTICKLDSKYKKEDIDEKTYNKSIQELKEEIKYYNEQATLCNVSQNAIKVTANSIYGFLGVDNGKYPLREALITVTAMGRNIWRKAEAIVYREEPKATIPYGDTDSLMISLAHMFAKEAYKRGKELAIIIAKVIGIGMECERMVKIMLLRAASAKKPKKIKVEDEDHPMQQIEEKKEKGAKKNYYMYVYDEDGKFKIDKDGKIELKKKGVSSVRRDRSILQGQLSDNVARMILENKTLFDICRYITDEAFKILGNKLPIDSFIISKSAGKTDTKGVCMNVFRDKMNAMGRVTKKGERLELIVLNTGDKKAKRADQYILKEFYDQNPKEYVINYEYYIENNLVKSIEPLLASLNIKPLINFLNNNGFTYVPPRKYKPITFETPVQMIQWLITGGYNPYYNIDLVEQFTKQYYNTY